MRPTEVATRFLTLITERHVEEALDLLDDSGTYRVNDLALGMEGTLADLKTTLRTVTSVVHLQFTIDRTFGDERTAAVETSSFAETSLGEYRNRYCFVVDVVDDRIVSLTEYLDTKPTEILLGAVVAEFGEMP